MGEIELLYQYNNLLKEAHEIQFHIKFCNKTIEKELWEEKYRELRKSISAKERELATVADKSSSNHALQRLMYQLNQYITEIDKAKYGLKLSRNQGMSLENHLFSIIVHDVHYIALLGFDAVRVPYNLYYTMDANDSVETSDLTAFLKEEKEILRNMHDPNYVILRRYFEDFTARIGLRFISSAQRAMGPI